MSLTDKNKRRVSAEEDSEDNPWRQSALDKPKYRGWLHMWAFWVSVPVLVVATATAPSFRTGYAIAHFGFGVSIMFGISALFHRREYTPEGWFNFRRMDHTGIYLCIAGGYTPVGMLALEGWQRPMLLSVGWAGAGLGIALRWMPWKPPYGAMTGLFIALSWAMVLAGPMLWRNMETWAFVLLVLGGVVYTVGALILGSRRPDPWPKYFGYHEIWHACVFLAVCLHWPVVRFSLV